MRSMYAGIACVAALCLVVAGCSSKPGPSSSQIVKVNESGNIEAPRDDSRALEIANEVSSKSVPRDDAEFKFENPFEPPVEGVDESVITGRWFFALPRDTAVSRPWLLEIAGTDDAYEVHVVDQAVQSRTAASDLKKTGDRVRFNLVINEKPCAFDGSLVEGRILGTLYIQGQAALAWLERTKLKSIGSQFMAVTPGAAEFDLAQRPDDPKQRVQQLLQFADKFAASPLAFDALQTVLRVAKLAESSEEELRAATDKYLERARPWGPRWTESSVESIAYILASADAWPAVALEFAEKAQAALPEDAAKSRIQLVRLSLAVALLRNDRAAESKKLFDELREQDSANDELRFYSALVAEKLGETDGAIDTLIGLWPHPLATRELERIWKAKHGTLADLDARLDTEYVKRYPPIAVEPYAGRADPSDGRVAVAELFTGTSCPPCVAADVAFEALARAFPRGDLVLLQYHLNVPGPDPFTNADSESRANYYNVPGTPVLFVDGKAIAPVGGGRRDGEDRYTVFRGVIEKELRRKSGAIIKLAATRDGDAIAISANVSGVAPASDNLRLRLAVVEESIRFSGLNGVRLHHFVVRAMPGGAGGVPVTETAFNHKATVSIAQLKSSLADGMAEIEKQFAFEFSAKPLDLERLSVAALVQDDATKEVLQSAFVAVE